MKVKCVNAEFVNTLTEDQTYEVVSKSRKMIRVINDVDDVAQYYLNRFEGVKAQDSGETSDDE